MVMATTTAPPATLDIPAATEVSSSTALVPAASGEGPEAPRPLKQPAKVGGWVGGVVDARIKMDRRLGAAAHGNTITL
jgi:hypothetical protein